MFGPSKSDVTYGALVAIGNDAIDVGIAASKEGSDAPTLLWHDRVEVRGNAEASVDPKILRDTIIAAAALIAGAGLVALKRFDTHAHIGKILVTAAAPFSEIKAHTIHVEEKTPFRVTESLVEDLERKADAEATAAHNTPESFDVVLRAIVGIRVNGYPVPQPEGQKGTALDLKAVHGLVSETLIAACKEFHEALPHTAPIEFHAHLFAVYLVIRDAYPTDDTVLILRVAAETTEIAIIEDDALVYASSMASGSNALQGQSAHGSLRAHHEDVLLTPSPVLSESLGGYRDTLSKFIRDTAGAHHVPHTVITIVEEVGAAPAIQNILPEVFKNATEREHRFIDPLSVLRNGLMAPEAVNIPLPSIVVLGRFFHKLGSRQSYAES